MTRQIPAAAVDAVLPILGYDWPDARRVASDVVSAALDVLLPGLYVTDDAIRSALVPAGDPHLIVIRRDQDTASTFDALAALLPWAVVGSDVQ